MPTCAEGHTSATHDYCDVCGAPMGGVEARSTAAPPAADCARPVRAPVEWTAVVRADHDFYLRVLANGGPDTVEFPQFFPERRIALRGDATLIGRRNRAQGVEPEIDLGIHPSDRGVSTQHAVLRIRASGPTITDLGSTNGTSLNDSDDLLRNGEETPVGDGDRIHVGAWTTITILQGTQSAQSTISPVSDQHEGTD